MSLDELILKCARSGDAVAWQEFVGRFHELIASVVLRTSRRWGSESPSLVDDLIQETYLKICSDSERILGEFSPQHPEAFYGFLKVVTANVVHDYFRSARTQKRGQGQFEVPVDDVVATGPSSGAEHIHRDILLKEVDKALVVASSKDDLKRDRTIFWLYYRYGFTAPAIACLPSINLSVKGVESVIHRLTRLIREFLTEGGGA